MLNKIVRSTPLLLVPLFMLGQAKSVDSEEPQNKPLPNAQQASKPLDLPKGFFKLPDLKLPKLTQEENRILDEMEDFLRRYTGNGKFNYGSIPRMIEGLKHDYKAVHEEAQSMSGLRRRAALRYPNNRFGRVYGKIQGEIASRAYTEITHELRTFKVDPNTANKPDNAPITNFVTKGALDRFTWNSYRLDDMSKKYLPADQKVIFPDGISIEAIRFIRSREIGKELGIPPGGKIVARK